MCRRLGKILYGLMTIVLLFICFGRVYLHSKSNLCLVLCVFNGPLYSIVDIVNNDRRLVSRLTSSIHASAEQYGRPLAPECALVRVAASDIRLYVFVSTSFRCRRCVSLPGLSPTMYTFLKGSIDSPVYRSFLCARNLFSANSYVS